MKWNTIYINMNFLDEIVKDLRSIVTMKNPFEKEEDDLKELLELEMQMEALQLENLLSDDDLEDLDISEEETEQSFQRLVQKLKNDSIYRPDDRKSDKVIAFDRSRTETVEKSVEEEATAAGGALPAKEIYEASPIVAQAPSSSIHSSSAQEKITKKRFSFGKVAGFAVVVLLSVFASSMTSEANRQYFMRRIQYFIGDKSMIVSYNDENIDWSLKEEMDAVSLIESKLDVEIPELYYKNNLVFNSYYLDEIAGIASIRYTYLENNTKATFYIYKQDNSSASYIVSKHGDKTINLPTQDITISIQESSNEKSEPEYDAVWIFNNAMYRFKGRFSWEEFEKIISGMNYYS